MKKNRLYIVLPAIALLAFACGSEEEQVIEKPSVKAEVVQLKSTEKLKENRFSGKVIADNKLILSTKILGQVEQVLVKEGEKITKGQLLVKIKSNDLSAKHNTAVSGVKTAELNMENMIKNYDRIKNLFDKGSATQKELEDMSTAKEAAITQYNQAKQQLAEINDYLSYANLTSPINGFISKKMMNVGDMAAPGQPVLALESMDELKVEVNVPEFEIHKFETNDSVTVSVDAVNAKDLVGTVERIVPSSTYSGQYKVVLVLNKENPQLKPGMFAQVNLLKDKTMKLLVPKSSIIQKGQLTGLYTVNQQNEAMLRWVRLGKDYGDHVEVLSGLIEGEQLVISTQSKITDGTKLQIAKK